MGLLDRILTRIMLLIAWPLAAKRMLDPEIEEETQLAWAANATRTIDATDAAQLVSEGLWQIGEGIGEASRQGIGRDRFASLVQMAEVPPDLADVRAMFRRGLIDAQAMEMALRRNRILVQYRAGMLALEEVLLSPADLANAVQQGFIPNDGLLPVTPPAGGGKVPSPPQIPIDPVKEAAGSGVTRDRLKVLAALAGLPPGPMELLEMVRRGVIDESDLLRGVAEGHTKTEWGHAYLAMLHEPLSASQLAEAVIKEWITPAEAHQRALAARISVENLDLLIKSHGRPPGPAQLQMAYNRGLIGEERFRKGIAESDVKTEWTDTLLAMRIRYPTTFALRQLVSSGAVPATEASTILQKQGWEPALADKVSKAWADQKTTRLKELTEAQILVLYEARYISNSEATDMLTRLGFPTAEIGYLLNLADARRVKRFLDTAIGKLHTLFVNHRITEQAATSGISELGVGHEAQGDLIATWKLEREANRPAISPAQIAAAVYYQIIPEGEGVQMLIDRGYTEHDARFVISVREHHAIGGGPL